MEKEEYLRRYRQRLIDRGLTEEGATALTETTEDKNGVPTNIEDEDPEGDADEELSYWASDG
jgi:hypothetical protein